MNDELELDLAPYFSSRRLRLLILPTEKCNFRCKYCYEDFTIGLMPSRVANGVVELIRSRRHDLDSLDVDWFGGEPLIAKKIIFSVGSAIFDICQDNQIEFRGSVTTNGYLLNVPVAQELFARGIFRYQISLDGPEHIHNARRPTAGGRPTFHVIVQNIKALLSTDLRFEMLLRIHFDRITYNEVRDFVASQVSEWAKDQRVSVLFIHIENLSTDPDAYVPQMHGAERATAIAELKSLIPGAVTNEDAIYVCYAAQPNAFIVRADGRVGKCTVALQDARNTIGYLTSDGKLVLDNEKARLWFRGWKTMNKKALACPYSYM